MPGHVTPKGAVIKLYNTHRVGGWVGGPVILDYSGVGGCIMSYVSNAM